MITIRKSAERGHANHGWLDTYHTFSFDTYYDPRHMSFRSLRVINEDRVRPDNGFGPHPHRDMEIITYILEGALSHQDSMGTGSTIRRGEVQRMSAGTGVTHSEFNHSLEEPVHLLQIWILPDRKGLKPSYEQKEFRIEEKRGRLLLIAAPTGRDGALTVHQDVELYAGILAPSAKARHVLKEGRHAWIQVASGSLLLNGTLLKAGDGAAISETPDVQIEGKEEAEFLLFDLA